MSSEVASPAFKFFGGRLCLDFANSLNWRLTETPVDLIPDYAGLLQWTAAWGTLPRAAVAALSRSASVEDARRGAVMAEARVLRADLIEAAAAFADARRPDLGAINRALPGLPPQPNLVEDGGRLVFDLDGTDPRQPLWPIVWSTTAVFASRDAGRIGTCRARGCGWFFVDESPNRSRLWCGDACGNRERVRRVSERRRNRTTSPNAPP